jgi:hypothetical protein
LLIHAGVPPQDPEKPPSRDDNEAALTEADKLAPLILEWTVQAIDLSLNIYCPNIFEDRLAR